MDFVIIANAWGALRDNPTSKHQIALELAAQGHRVLWLEGAGMRRPSLGSGSDRGRIGSKLRLCLRGARNVTQPGVPGSIHVVTPLLVPLPAIGWVRRMNGLTYRAVGGLWSLVLGFRRPVLINYVPVLADAMRGWRGTVLYHCVDRWDKFGMYDAGLMARMDLACMGLADLVIASSRDLADHCMRWHRRVFLVSHGVNREHFSRCLTVNAGPRPADLPEGPIVGFFGLLSEWVDQELLARLAAELPGATVVLIGKADVAISRLERSPGIRLLGSRPYADLPDYVAHFTVGIIPFQVNELTSAVNPIKLREMLAAGCPVVATALPEVAAYARDDGARGVAVAATADEFVDQVRAYVQNPLSRAERERLSAAMEAETWRVKVNEIVEIVKGLPTIYRGTLPV